MRTFLVAMSRQDYAEASRCLDLDGAGVPAVVQAIKGRELATQLKDAIDRVRLVDYEEIPGEPSGRPYEFFTNDVGSITLASDDAGDWRFSAETVRAIPNLLISLRGNEIVAGVEEVSRTPALWLRSKMPAGLLSGPILEIWQWLGLVLLALLGVIADRLSIAVSRLTLVPWLRRSISVADPTVLNGAVRPLGLLLMAGVWGLGILLLGLPGQALQILLLAVKVVAAAAAVWSAFGAVDVGSEILARRVAKTDNRFDDLLVPLVRTSTKVFLGAFGLIFIADNLEIQVGSLLAGLGLGGVALALAAQDTIRNLFGSLTVLLDRPLTVGDWVCIDSLEGTVEEVGFRSIRIRTFYDSLVTLPNGKLITAAVDNYGERRYRRWKTTLSVTWDTPPELVEAFCEGVRELIREHPYTRKDYYHVYLNEFGDSSLNVMLYMFFETPDWSTELRERHRLALDILRLAQHLGVSFAFPSRSLYIQRPSERPEETVSPDGYLETRTASLRNSRRTARDLAVSGLGDETPAPVDFEDFPGT